MRPPSSLKLPFVIKKNWLSLSVKGQPPFDPNYPTGYVPPPDMEHTMSPGSYPGAPPPYAPPPIGFVSPAGSYYPTAASPQTGGY